MTETLAITLAKDGDQDAFGFLYKLHYTNVYRRCVGMMKSVDDAEDAVQEVFLKLLTKIKLFRGESKFSVWLFRLTTNVCIELHRSKKRKLPEFSFQPADSASTRGAANYSDSDVVANLQKRIPDRGIDALNKLCLHDAYQRLSPELQDAFTESIEMGYTAEQICRSRGMMPSAGNAQLVRRQRVAAQKELAQAVSLR